MSFSPNISIVMPCYQQVAYLEEAVRSVLDQEGVDVELLVMDPGSTDGSREQLQGLKAEYGERLQLHFAPDKGQSDAINRGMALARGNVLAWLNSDDRFHPGALKEVAPYLDSEAALALALRYHRRKNCPIPGPVAWQCTGGAAVPLGLLRNLSSPAARSESSHLGKKVVSRCHRHDMDYDSPHFTVAPQIPQLPGQFPVSGQGSTRLSGNRCVAVTARQHAPARLERRLPSWSGSYGLRTKIIYRIIVIAGFPGNRPKAVIFLMDARTFSPFPQPALFLRRRRGVRFAGASLLCGNRQGCECRVLDASA
jgi:hypothetical protein